MNQLELLSPAGDIEIFKAVVNAGADAVYFGGDLFGARAYAKNFSIDEAAEAIRYAHFHGAKAYLTVNTLLKNLEIEKDLFKYLRAYVENGIDAFIIQDIGVFQLIKDYFPSVDLHASTQMSLCTRDGASLLQSMGASRIVTAREISLNEIADIHNTCPNLEIESFIHGALCVCYSGQCLMSSMIGGRSGNRGRCAQPCRLPYKVYDSNGQLINTKGDYILSPKDFCTINSLKDMIEAGVMSFKIEGRMKQLSYATGVVSVYRKYLDLYLENPDKELVVLEQDIQKLLDYGNRSGFTDLYMSKHNGKELITFEEPSHSKANTEAVIYPERKIKVNCHVKAKLGQAFALTYTDLQGNTATASGNIIEKSEKKPATREDIFKGASGLGATAFELNELTVDMDEGIFLPVSVIKNARREAIELLSKNFLNNEAHVINNFVEIKAINPSVETSKEPFVVVANLQQLKECINFDFVNKIAVPIELFDVAIAFDTKKEIYVTLPTIIRQSYLEKLVISERAAGVVVCSMDGIGLVERLGYPKEKIILDHRLYTFSNRSIQAFENMGYKNNCIPLELSLKELSHRDNSNSQFVIYSRYQLMVTANCTYKNTRGCNKGNNEYYIKDRKGENLPVKCNCTYCYNTIYNGKRFIAFGLLNEIEKLNAREYRIDFSLESPKEVNEILLAYEKTVIKGMPYNTNEDHTKGHLKRGVE